MMDGGTRTAMFLRSLLLQACWNRERMQNLGFAYALAPGLERAWGKGEAFRAALARHLDFFNTQPYMASFALGVVANLEEKAARAPREEREKSFLRIEQVKRALGSGLAGMGDAFFWGALKPAFAAGTPLLWAVFWLGGARRPILLGTTASLVLYNIPALTVRWRGLAFGYAWGERVGERLSAWPREGLTRLVRGAGLAAVGALCAAFLLVPPLGGPTRGWHAAALAAALALRRAGAGSLGLYALAVAAGLVVSLSGAG